MSHDFAVLAHSEETDERSWRSEARDQVLFFVQVASHFHETLVVQRELAKFGYGSRIVVLLPQMEMGKNLRSANKRAREVLATAHQIGFLPVKIRIEDILQEGTACLVVRNDWGVGRQLVSQARSTGIQTVGWVEGVQDFKDVDTGRVRNPYGHVDRVLCLGEFDKDALRPQIDASIVGSQRIWELFHGRPTTKEVPLLVNVNFSYGVLARHRRRWTVDAVRAAQRSSTPILISRHPADRGLRGRRSQSHKRMDDLLPQTARLVSRFSTVIYDALALGVDVIYHNPHGERVPTFKETMGAFTVTSSRTQLVQAITATSPCPEVVRQSAKIFLEHHVHLGDEPPARLAAREIAKTIR